MSSQIVNNLYAERLYTNIIRGNDQENVNLIKVDKINGMDVSDNYISLERVQFKNDQNRYYIGLSNNNLIFYDDVNDMELIKFNRLTQAIEFNPLSEVIIPDLSAGNINIADGNFDFLSVTNDASVNGNLFVSGDICNNGLNNRLQVIEISLNLLDISVNLIENRTDIIDASIATLFAQGGDSSGQIHQLEVSMNLLENRTDVIDVSINNISLDLTRIDLSLTGVTETTITKTNVTATGDLSAVGVTLKNVEITGNEMTLPEVFTFNPAPLDNSGEVQIKGNLRVLGTEFITNIEQLNISGAWVVTNTDAEIVNSGLRVTKPDGSTVQFYFNPTNGKFETDISVNIPSTLSVGEQLGVGTTATPDELLHVNNPSGTARSLVQGTAFAYNKVKTNTAEFGVGASGTRLAFYDYTAATERLSVIANGDIGIGTTAPTKKLEVNGTAKVSGILDAGSIGVGTDAPAELLHVVSNGATPRLEVENTGGNFAFFKMTNSGGGSYGMGTSSNSYYIWDYNTSQNRLNIDGNGLVSISQNLDVIGDVSFGGLITNTALTTEQNLQNTRLTTMETFAGQLDASSAVAFNRLNVIDSSINTIQSEINDLSENTLREDASFANVDISQAFKVTGDICSNFSSTIIVSDLEIGKTGSYAAWRGIKRPNLDANGFALLQNIGGSTIVNAADGEYVGFSINNVRSGKLNANGDWYFGVGNEGGNNAVFDFSGDVFMKDNLEVIGDLSNAKLDAIDASLAALNTIGLNDVSGILYNVANFPKSIKIGDERTGTLNNALSNTIIGYNTATSIANAGLNVFVGNEIATAVNLGAAQCNVATGYNAMEDLTSANNCTAVGYEALRRNQSSNDNTALGAFTLNNNLSTFNTAVGSGALRNLSSVAGSYNVALGANAGQNNNGSQNVFLGVAAGLTLSASSQNNCVYVGNNNYSSGLSALDASYEIVMGSTAIGKGSNTTLIGTPNKTLECYLVGDLCGNNTIDAIHAENASQDVSIGVLVNQVALNIAELNVIDNSINELTALNAIQDTSINDNDASLIQTFQIFQANNAHLLRLDASLTIVDTSINTLQSEINDLSENTLREDASFANVDISQNLKVAYDTDTAAYIGRAKVGFDNFTDWASFSHLDSTGATKYALLQSSAGKTLVNGVSSEGLHFRLDNQDQIVLNNENLIFGRADSDGVPIKLNNVTTITNDLSVNGNVFVTGDSTFGGEIIFNGEPLSARLAVSDISVNANATNIASNTSGINNNAISIALNNTILTNAIVATDASLVIIRNDLVNSDLSLVEIQNEQNIQDISINALQAGGNIADLSIAILDLSAQLNSLEIVIIDNSVNLIEQQQIVQDNSINAANITKTNITVLNDLSVNGIIHGAANMLIDPQATADNTGKVSILGDLEVRGTTTTIHSENLDVSNETITLCANVTGTPPTNLQSGLVVERGSESNAKLLFNEANDKWSFKIGNALAPLNVSELNTGELEVNSVNINNLFDASWIALQNNLAISDASINTNTTNISANVAHLSVVDQSINDLVDVSASHWTRIILIQDAADANTLTNNTQNNRLNVLDVSVSALENSQVVQDISIGLLVSNLAITDASVNAISIPNYDTSFDFIDSSLSQAISLATTNSGRINVSDISIQNLFTNLAITDNSVNNAGSGSPFVDISVTNISDISQADISYLTINNAFTLPTSIGSASQVLVVPSSGSILEWADQTGSGGGGSGGGSSTTNSLYRAVLSSSATNYNANQYYAIDKSPTDDYAISASNASLTTYSNTKIFTNGCLNSFNTGSSTLTIDKVFVKWNGVATEDTASSDDISFSFYKCSFNGSDPTSTINSALIETFEYAGDNSNYFSGTGNRNLHINETKTFSSAVSLAHGEFISWEFGTNFSPARYIQNSESSHTAVVVQLLESSSGSGSSGGTSITGAYSTRSYLGIVGMSAAKKYTPAIFGSAGDLNTQRGFYIEDDGANGVDTLINGLFHDESDPLVNNTSSSLTVTGVIVNALGYMKDNVNATDDLTLRIYQCARNGTDPDSTITTTLRDTYVYEGDNATHFSGTGNKFFNGNLDRTFASSFSLASGESIKFELQPTNFSGNGFYYSSAKAAAADNTSGRMSWSLQLKIA
jgi:hypothetical protein